MKKKVIIVIIAIVFALLSMGAVAFGDNQSIDYDAGVIYRIATKTNRVIAVYREQTLTSSDLVLQKKLIEDAANQKKNFDQSNLSESRIYMNSYFINPEDSDQEITKKLVTAMILIEEGKRLGIGVTDL